MNAAKKPAKLVVPMKAVKSASIAEHGYDAATQTLAIMFHNKVVWHYHDVSPEAAAKFGSADSVGKHFAAHIRDRFKGSKQ